MTDGDKPTSEDRPLWSLSRDEQRVLAITFVGGLASLIVAAGVIGAAIALGRWVEHESLGWFTQFAQVGGLALAILGGLAGRSKRTPLYGRFIGWIVAAIGVLGLLVIVGIGAGIH